MAPLPDVFLPYQQRFMRAIDTHPVVVVEKSRRTGFSWAAAAVAMLTASAAKSARGDDVFYMGYNLEMAREFIDYTADWARKVDPAARAVLEGVWTDPDHPERQIRTFRVEFDSGFKVLALPSVPRALRGMQGLVIIDEAAFHDQLEELLKAAFALLIWGGRVVIISTHSGDTNPFNQLVTDIRAGRRPYYLGRTTFDDALADGLYRRICLTTGKTWSEEAEAAWRAEIIAFYGDAAEEELFAVPSASTGTWLPGPLIEARADAGIPVIRRAWSAEFSLAPAHHREAELRFWCDRELGAILSALNQTEPHVFGLDFARRGDLTVLWVLAISSLMVRRTVCVIELRNCPFEQQKQVLFYLCDRLPKFRAAALDATGNGMYLAEVAAQRYGERVAQVMLNEPWYREHMPAVKAAFEDATISVPRDRELIDDLRQMKMVRGVARVPERTRNDEGLGRHGDGAIALALAVFAAKAPPEEYAYQGGLPAPLRQDVGRKWTDQPDTSEDDAPPPGSGWIPHLRGFA